MESADRIGGVRDRGPEVRQRGGHYGALAGKLGNAKLLNMAALGAWLCATKALPLEAVQEALSRVISSFYAKLIPSNAAALAMGYDFVRERGQAYSK